MRSQKDIERAFKQAHLDVEINTETDRTILNGLVATHETSRRTTARHMVPKFAIAAIIMMAALLATHSALRDVPRKPRGIPQPSATMSAAEMLTVGQLKAAYGRGGLEALEAQCERAAEKVDVKQKELSIRDLILELGGT